MIVVSMVLRTVLCVPTDRILPAGSSLRNGVDGQWWIRGRRRLYHGIRALLYFVYPTSYLCYTTTTYKTLFIVNWPPE